MFKINFILPLINIYILFQFIFIELGDFNSIMKRYSFEYSYLQTCIKEFSPSFDDLFRKLVLKHRDVSTDSFKEINTVHEILSDLETVEPCQLFSF